MDAARCSMMERSYGARKRRQQARERYLCQRPREQKGGVDLGSFLEAVETRDDDLARFLRPRTAEFARLVAADVVEGVDTVAPRADADAALSWLSVRRALAALERSEYGTAREYAAALLRGDDCLPDRHDLADRESTPAPKFNAFDSFDDFEEALRTVAAGI